jgi:zinc protease
MVKFERHTLKNGLRVLVNPDNSTPMAACNLLYDVGAKDEDPQQTGFAHLFEHLMFEGSLHVPHFDKALQHAGGDNNAFTTNDITNYYITLPATRLETAFWLESDRMLGLAFSEEKLIVQKNVVIEEYRQSFLNQPYGDTWLLLRPLCYKKHPYQWGTIGKNIDHIRGASLDAVKSFFKRFYHPANAILVVAGQVDPHEVFMLAEKWFGDIPRGREQIRQLPAEPAQTEARQMKVVRDVPASQLYMSFPTCSRMHPDFYATDLLSDVLANGPSSRLTSELVKGRKLFAEADAHISGSLDPGMFVIQGKLHTETSFETAESALWEMLQRLKDRKTSEKELQKLKNKGEAAHAFAECNVLARAMNLAYYELMGDADLLNQQIMQYAEQKPEDLQRLANDLFAHEKSSVLYYQAKDGIMLPHL